MYGSPRITSQRNGGGPIGHLLLTRQVLREDRQHFRENGIDRNRKNFTKTTRPLKAKKRSSSILKRSPLHIALRRPTPHQTPPSWMRPAARDSTSHVLDLLLLIAYFGIFFAASDKGNRLLNDTSRKSRSDSTGGNSGFAGSHVLHWPKLMSFSPNFGFTYIDS